MASGTVKWFNNAKGWGFLNSQEGTDVFIHYSQIDGQGYRTLREGDVVMYERRKGPRGLYAQNVQIPEQRSPMHKPVELGVRP